MDISTVKKIIYFKNIYPTQIQFQNVHHRYLFYFLITIIFIFVTFIEIL